MSLGKYVNPKNGSVAYPSDQEDVDILLESGHVKEEATNQLPNRHPRNASRRLIPSPSSSLPKIKEST
jgi:hypothetical protein